MSYLSLQILIEHIKAGSEAISVNIREPVKASIFWPWHKRIVEIHASWANWDAGLIAIPFPLGNR